MFLGITACYRAYPEGIRQSGPFGFSGRIDQPAPAASSPGCLPDVGLVLRKSAFAVQSRKARKGVGRTVSGTDVIWWSHQLRNTYPTLFLYQRVFTFSTKIRSFFYNFLADGFCNKTVPVFVIGTPWAGYQPAIPKIIRYGLPKKSLNATGFPGNFSNSIPVQEERTG